VADDDKFSFTDGTDDLPFTVSALIKSDDLSSEVPIVTKYGLGREFNFYVQDSDLALYVWDGTNSAHTRTASAITGYNGQWIHVAATYSGTSGGVFSAAADGINLFINGVAQTITAANNASYTGIANTSEVLRLGARLGIFGSLHLRDVKIFNRELTADEVAELARGNDLGFADEWGGALGGVFTQDATPSGEFAGVYLTDADEAGPIGGKSNILKLTVNTASGVLHYATFSGASGTAGKRLRLKCYAYVPSANSNTDGIWIYQSSGSGKQEQSITPDTWVPLEFEFVSNGNVMVVAMLDGTSSSFADAGSDDILYLADLTVTQIGTLADFRSERYDTSTSKLYDNSDNAFVGTGTSVSLTGREQPVYETGTWTPTLSGSTTTDFTYSSQNGYYTRTGDTVFVRGYVAVSALGTSAGNIKVEGLPFTSSSAGSNSSVLNTYVSNMAALSSGVVGLVGDGTTNVALVDTTSTGTASVTIGNLTATSIIRISGTYQIQ
jgi:hypothetical protein